jgi:abequosyltransferase
MDHDLLISICIPTYNNADCLKECLESLLPQIKPYQIPVYVSDNASTDNTIEMLSSFKNECYPLLYFRSNNKNLGYGQNAVYAARMASSKYVWSFGDRRRLMPDSVKIVYSTLCEDDLDLLVLNNESTQQLGQVISARDTRYTSARTVFRELFFVVGTVGLQILPAEAWKSKLLEKYLVENYHDWIHLSAIFEFLAGLKTVNVLFLAQPLVDSTNRWEPTCTPRHFEVWTTWKNTINALPKSYTDGDKQFAIRCGARLAYFPTNTLLLLRSRGIYNESVFNMFREDFLRYTNTSLSLARTISMLPVPFLRLYYELYDIGRKGLRTFIHTRAPLNPQRIHAFPQKRQQTVQN